MKKVLAIAIAMVLVFGISGVAFAQDFNDDSNIITLPVQENIIGSALGDGGEHETEIETGDATGGDHNWAIALNIPITAVDPGSGSSNFRGQSYSGGSGSSNFDGQSFSSNPIYVNNGDMCATANGGGNANSGDNSIIQKIKQKNVIKQKLLWNE